MIPDHKSYMMPASPVSVPTDKFKINFGYKNRCSVQVRLDGESVLCSVDDGSIKLVSLPFLDFVQQFREFVVAAESGKPDLTQAFLRHLVDVVWQTCTESEAVPSTDWADRMIESARKSLKSESHVCSNSCGDDGCP